MEVGQTKNKTIMYLIHLSLSVILDMYFIDTICGVGHTHLVGLTQCVVPLNMVALNNFKINFNFTEELFYVEVVLPNMPLIIT